MTQEEKEILLKDLCARLPYKPKVRVEHDIFYDEREPYDTELNLSVLYNRCACTEIKPYLRPMSSMTEEENKELFYLMGNSGAVQRMDFYNSHYLDCRGLIPMGLALEAPEGMYKTK